MIQHRNSKYKTTHILHLHADFNILPRKWGSNHRDRRESMLMSLYLCLLDKFKLVFVYDRFNIS